MLSLKGPHTATNPDLHACRAADASTGTRRRVVLI
jgi:hypothetical protein